MPDPITVRVRDCACPHTPHADEGDLVYVHPTLSLDGGIAAQQDITASRTDAGGVDADALTRRWTATFVRSGAYGWNLLGEDGAPVPFDVGAILADFEMAAPVVDAIEDRYSEAVLRPLGLGRPKSSPTGPTAASTSRTRKSRA